MAETVREIERKYEAVDGAGPARLPDLTRAEPVAGVRDRGVVELDAVYYDTADRRLLAAGVTLRRRTGGSDAGWHLKLPVAPGVRDEVRAPLTAAARVPRALAALVRSRVRETPLVPVARIATRRDVSELVDADGAVLAEVAVDAVTVGEGDDAWTEVEVELAEGAGPELLDALEPHLREGGLRPARAGSKLARALGALAAAKAVPPVDAGGHVLAYVREQVEAVVALDPGARRGTEDAVHQMRVATRRLRSAFRTYGKVLDRRVTDPLGAELRWLAGELGVDRDREVLVARLRERLGELPRVLVRGPVRARLRVWSVRNRVEARRRLTAVLDGPRYLALLDALDVLVADPPLRAGAARSPEKVLAKAVRRDYGRLSARVEHALATDPGPERDAALHDARKAAKRARYAAEAAAPALGKDARRLVKRMKAVQTVLGDHQDSVLARGALRAIAAQAEGAGESAFTYGVLYGREEARAGEDERALPGVWGEGVGA
ncbi:CYTH and CHAD domain-containing protein [Streptomyces sp. AV19]|uniref:CYTH and CHAD domain-containing protein n=1 Tax=Streptomyces sp. AV19 TaxID=2793068 RepID=UPI0018FE9923|nr:CYTH and CHAD domain-containing protein [Streptomyces sp. AV19]MBH1933117.1 CYTH and CHAD domain-containing protein [Streptomyces sp. AV19]MDG4531830.1 CYTH and CHAD domain-containing protein [Streptomyces sp. AV19]